MSGFGFWGGPGGVAIPTAHIEGQQEVPYFHSGPGFSHQGNAADCRLPHPGDAAFDDPEVWDDLARQGEIPDPYQPRHRRPDASADYALAQIDLPAPVVPLRSELKWVGVDFDGTIAESVWTPENPTSQPGEPIWRNLGKLVQLADAGYKIVVHTSRPWSEYEVLETWLNHHGIPWHQIQCGKPLFALYVDDRGRHESAESWLP